MDIHAKRTVRYAGHFLWRRRRRLTRAGVVPALLMLAVKLLAEADGPRPLAATLLLVFIASFIAFHWTRRLLVGHTGMAPGSGVMAVDGHIIGAGDKIACLLGFQIRLIALCAVLYLVGTGVSALVPGILSAASGRLFYFAAGIAFLASPLIARLGLAVPATAIGYPRDGFIDAWHMSRGHGWQLVKHVWALIAISVAAALVLGLVQEGLELLVVGAMGLPPILANVAGQLVAVVLIYGAVALWATVAAAAFYRLCPNISDYALDRPDLLMESTSSRLHTDTHRRVRLQA